MDREALPDVDLKRYLRGLLRRKVTVLLVILVAVSAAIGISLVQRTLYAGQAQVVLESKQGESLFSQTAAPPTDPQVTVDTAIQVIKSPPVHAAVTARLGPVDKVVATRVGQTLVIAIRGIAGTASRAAEVANAYAAAYLDLSQQRAAADFTQAAQQLQAQIDDIQAQIDQINTRLGTTPATQQVALNASLTSLSSQQDTFRQRLSEVRVDASLASGGAQLVASASPPTSPVQPTPIRNIILALAAGLILGIGLASLLEYRDDRIRSVEDLEQFRPLPVLAKIPLMSGRSHRHSPALALTAGSTAAAESYRALRTAVQLLGVIRPLTVIQFTSPTPGDGKTTTVANLATVLADAGRRVVVVDCDLRRPLLNQVFGLTNPVGLTSVLLGDIALTEAVQPVPGFEGLFVLTAGAMAPNPSELLSSRKTAEIIFALQSRFDIVLLDSPPLLPVTDAVVLSEWVEAVVVVTASGITSRKALSRAIQLLRQTAAPIVGLVLNRAEADPAYTYYYGPGEGVGRRDRQPPSTDAAAGHQVGPGGDDQKATRRTKSVPSN